MEEKRRMAENKRGEAKRAHVHTYKRAIQRLYLPNSVHDSYISSTILSLHTYDQKKISKILLGTRSSRYFAST